MKLTEYIEKAWNDHATAPKMVFESFDSAKDLIETNDEIPALVRLITHVSGDHLGLWNEGIQKLQELTRHPCYLGKTESDFAIARSTATLKMCADKTISISEFSLSDRIRILAMAAGPLLQNGDTPRATECFSEALELAIMGLAKEDPANRALAVAGNTLACSLEDKKNRTDTDVQLMILAAKTARKYWELAGGPPQVAMAEYRLSQTYLQAKMRDQSYEHAQECVELCEINKLSSLDHFYGYEALALAERERKNQIGFAKALAKVQLHFQQLSPEDQEQHRATIKNLT